MFFKNTLAKQPQYQFSIN